MRRFRFEYGAGPAHLLVGIASFLLAAWALSHAFNATSQPRNLLFWLVGAIIAHDLMFLPLYSALGRIAGGAFARGGEPPGRLRVAALNHLRVPALLSSLAFLVWFPLILGIKDRGFMRITGQSVDVYMQRWLLLSLVLFGGSALLLAVRARALRESA